MEENNEMIMNENMENLEEVTSSGSEFNYALAGAIVGGVVAIGGGIYALIRWIKAKRDAKEDTEEEEPKEHKPKFFKKKKNEIIEIDLREKNPEK